MTSQFELTDDTPVYVISVAAQLSGLHPQTLRAYDRLGRPAQAVPDWDGAVELSPPAEQPGLRAARAGPGRPHEPFLAAPGTGE